MPFSANACVSLMLTVASACALQDPVPRVGKLGVLYSRPGKRVLVDQDGDMQVRPTPLDIRLSSANPGTWQVRACMRENEGGAPGGGGLEDVRFPAH